MRELVFLAAIFLSLTVVRTDNMCSGSRASGLLATTLCRNPTTGEAWSDDSSNCEFKAAKTQACCTKLDDCPIPETPSNSLDEYGDYDYGSRVQNIQTQAEERLCPVNRLPCTYNVDDFSDDIESDCTTLEELNEFAACQQGCDEIFPSEIPAEPVEPEKKDDDDEDYFSIAFLGGRSDAIGGQEEKRCGTRDFEETILPGNEAFLGEFPWACSVFTQDKGNKAGKYLGGCTIIPNERDNDIHKPTYRVITAASKLDLAAGEPLKVRVRFTDNSKGNFKEDDHTVSQFINHPDFKKGRLTNNIATMALDKPINLVQEEGVNAACLPGCNDMFDHTFENHTGVRCWSAGFGATEKNGPEEFILQKVDIPIFPNKQKCEDVINKAITEARGGKKGRRTKLNAGEICAGGEAGKDTCSGDGGSPLVCQAVSGRWHVVGLVSWGIGCGVEGRPAIYTNVHHYLDFIYSLIGPCSDKNWYQKGAGRNPKITCPGE